MATKPTSDPKWGTAPAANVQEPASQRLLGYPDTFIPPAGAHNWQFQTIGAWLDWLRRGGLANDLADGVATTAAGESFVLGVAGEPGKIFDADLRVGGGSLTDINVEATALALDAAQVFLGIGAVVYAYPTSGLFNLFVANAAWNVNLAAYGTTVVGLDSNGTYVGVAMSGGEWVILDAADGSVLFNGDHTAALSKVALNGSLMAVSGIAAAGNEAIRIINLSTGSVISSVTWGVSADVYDIAWVDSSRLAVVAEDDGSLNDVGVVFSGGGDDWRVASTRTMNPGAVVTSNGHQIFVHNGDTGAWLMSFSPYDGSELWETTTSPNPTQPGICCDSKYLYLRHDHDGDIYAYTHEGRLLTTTTPAGTTGVAAPAALIAANGDRVITAYNTGAFTAGVEVYYSTLTGRRWFRTATAPHFIQATPEVL